MQIFTKIIAAISALLFSIAGLNPSVMNFTEGKAIIPHRQNYRFDNSKLLIGGYYGGEGLGQLAKSAKLDFVIDSGVTGAELDEFYENGVRIDKHQEPNPKESQFPHLGLFAHTLVIGPRLTFDRRRQMLDVHPPDLVQEISLVLRGGDRGLVHGVHHPVLGTDRQKGVHVDQRQHREGQENHRKVKRHLSAACLHSPRLSI